MKNIYLLPTEKLSRLFKFANELHLDNTPKDYYKKYNIYITSANEEIKEGDWCIVGNGVSKLNTQFTSKEEINTNWKKIILTTDQDLIKNGVQKIDDEFLEWFVKNPSCEFVDVYNDKSVGYEYDHYSIIIPQEEPKQETLEEAARKWYSNTKLFDKGELNAFIAGAKWQTEKMPVDILKRIISFGDASPELMETSFIEIYEKSKRWLEQNKIK
jgi:hypothetical protein